MDDVKLRPGLAAGLMLVTLVWRAAGAQDAPTDTIPAYAQPEVVITGEPFVIPVARGGAAYDRATVDRL